MKTWLSWLGALAALALIAADSPEEKASPNDNKPPEGFEALFNGKDVTGWQGLVPIWDRLKLSAEQLKVAYKRFVSMADEKKLVRDTDLIYIVESSMDTPAAI